jgi:hypothetical protein
MTDEQRAEADSLGSTYTITRKVVAVDLGDDNIPQEVLNALVKRIELRQKLVLEAFLTPPPAWRPEPVTYRALYWPRSAFNTVGWVS